MDFIKQKKEPCAVCPYKLGMIKTVINPCPACRMNGYKSFRQFTEKLNSQTDKKDD